MESQKTKEKKSPKEKSEFGGFGGMVIINECSIITGKMESKQVDFSSFEHLKRTINPKNNN